MPLTPEQQQWVDRLAELLRVALAEVAEFEEESFFELGRAGYDVVERFEKQVKELDAALKATLREAGSGTRSIRSKFPGLPSLWFKTHHRLVEEDLSELPEVCAMLQHTSSVLWMDVSTHNDTLSTHTTPS